MAADNRYPYMRRLNGCPIPQLNTHDSSRVTRWANGIASSTNTYAWWHDLWKRPVWTLRDAAIPIVAEVVVLRQDGSLMLPDPDGVRRSIYAGRPSAKEKERMIQLAEMNAAQDKRIAREKYLDDIRPEALSRAESITTNRVSVLAR